MAFTAIPRTAKGLVCYHGIDAHHFPCSKSSDNPSRSKNQFPDANNVQPMTSPRQAALSSQHESLHPALFVGATIPEDSGDWSWAIEVGDLGKVYTGRCNYYDNGIVETTTEDHINLAKANSLVEPVARAAGIIYLKLNGDHMLSMSGFFVTGSIFMTCAYFNSNNTPVKTLKLLQQPGSGLCTISQDSHPSSISNGTKNAHLLHHDMTADYALFKLDGGQQSVKDFVGSSALQSMTSLPDGTLRGSRAFTIGYNSYEQTEKWDQNVNEYLSRLSPVRQASIQQQRPMTLSERPSLKDCLNPGRKTISLGRLQGPEKDFSGLPNDNGFHSIPGWYGISGSMIGCIVKEGEQEPAIKIVGLFTPGVSNERHNRMLCFSPTILEDIHEYVRSGAE